jgi:hypothetical protein
MKTWALFASTLFLTHASWCADWNSATLNASESFNEAPVAFSNPYASDLAGLTRSRCNVILGPILKESENHGKETSYS